MEDVLGAMKTDIHDSLASMRTEISTQLRTTRHLVGVAEEIERQRAYNVGHHEEPAASMLTGHDVNGVPL